MRHDAFELTLLHRAENALAKARTIEQVKNARDVAHGAKAYLQRASCSRGIRLEAARLAVQAEHALGTALANNGSHGRRDNAAQRKTLAELGLTKVASHRAQLIAFLSRDSLELWLDDQCAAGREPTLTGARSFTATRRVRPASRP